MLKEYTVHFCDPLLIIRSMISNPDFKGQFDYAPVREFEDGVHHWTDVMSGNWAWRQVVHHFLPMSIAHTAQDAISVDPDTHGSMVVPLLLSSNKTLASNTTSQNKFHPLHLSLRNVKNPVRHAHCNAIVPIGFLAIPKSMFLFFHI